MSITNNDAFVSIAAMNDTIDYNHDNDATYDHKEDDDLVIDGLISTSRMKLLEAQLLDQTLADHNDLEDDQDIFLLMQLVEKNDNARGHDITIKDMDETLRKLEEWNRIKSNYLDAIENDQRVKEINKSSASTEIRPETNDAIDSVTTNQDYYEIPDVKLSSVRLEQLERKIESLEDLIKSNAANESKNLEYMNNCEFVTSNKKLSGIEAELEVGSKSIALTNSNNLILHLENPNWIHGRSNTRRNI